MAIPSGTIRIERRLAAVPIDLPGAVRKETREEPLFSENSEWGPIYAVVRVSSYAVCRVTAKVTVLPSAVERLMVQGDFRLVSQGSEVAKRPAVLSLPAEAATGKSAVWWL